MRHGRETESQRQRVHRLTRRSAQHEACLFRRPSPFARVTATTGSNNVAPCVIPTLGLRGDVIKVLGRASTILALMIVAEEHRATRGGERALTRHMDVVAKTNDSGSDQRCPFAPPDRRMRRDHVGTATEDEDNRPPSRDDGKRLISSVENQRPCHGEEATRIRRLRTVVIDHAG